jgi:histidine ammonia-lyase
MPMRRTAAQALSLTGEDLTRSEFYDVVLQGRRVHLSPRATKRMSAAYRVIQAVVARPDPVYGVTTGFGKFAD